MKKPIQFYERFVVIVKNGSKVWHNTSKCSRTFWQCNGKFNGDAKCSAPHLYERDLQRIFMEFVNSLIKNCIAITGGLNEALMSIVDNASLRVRIAPIWKRL